MRQVVPAQVAIAPKLFAAIVEFAHVWLLVRVGAHVGFQVAALVEHLLADVALMRRALLMDHLVNGQRSRLTKALLAHRALERLLVRVNESVLLGVCVCLVDELVGLIYFVLECNLYCAKVGRYSRPSLVSQTNSVLGVLIVWG